MDVQKIGDLMRRIRATLEDGQINTDPLALYKQEVIGKRIVRVMCTGETHETALLKIEQARRQMRKNSNYTTPLLRQTHPQFTTTLPINNTPTVSA